MVNPSHTQLKDGPGHHLTYTVMNACTVHIYVEYICISPVLTHVCVRVYSYTCRYRETCTGSIKILSKSKCLTKKSHRLI